MKQKIKILSLGIPRLFWTKFSHLIKTEIRQVSIVLEFIYVGKKFTRFKEICAETIQLNTPDIIFTSLALFKNLGELECIITESSQTVQNFRPEIYLIENKLEKTLKSALNDDAQIQFNFANYGNLLIQDTEIIAPFSSDFDTVFEIDPAPMLNADSNTYRYLNKEKTAWIVSPDDISNMIWHGRTYALDDFMETFPHLTTHNKRTNGQPVFLVSQKKVYLSYGLQLRDLIEIKTDSISIQHILSFIQIKKGSPNFNAFLFKLNEQIKYQLSEKLFRANQENCTCIKASIPVTICTDYPIISKIFWHILRNDGYNQVLTADQTLDQSERFLVNISKEPADDSIFNKNIIIEESIFDIPGFPQVTLDVVLRPPAADDSSDCEEMKSRRKQLLLQVKKLSDQIKNLSSSKILADQEKYTNSLAGRKLEIVTVLLDTADIWSENSDDLIKTYEENVLVFYDDQIQASIINKLIHGDGRRIFWDISDNMGNLKSFVRLNTDLFEPFLHDGIILCCASTKNILLRKIQQFQHDLSQKKYPDVSDAIIKLKSEKQSFQKQLIKLAYQECWFELNKFYQENAEQIYQAACEAKQHLTEINMSHEKISNICIASISSQSCETIESAIRNAYEDLNSVNYHHIHAKLELASSIPEETLALLKRGDTSDEDKKIAERQILAQINAKKISKFLNEVSNRVNEISFEMVVIEHDIDLVYLLIEELLNANPRFKSIPVVALFSGSVNPERMTELSCKGVKLIYRNQVRIKDLDYLVHSLTTIL